MTVTPQNSVDDGRLSFADACAQARQKNQTAFAAMPVFGDNEEAAEGARIFIIEPHGAGEMRLRFIAGPFFSAAYAANDIIPTEDIPASVRELRFMPTRCEEDWFSQQIQIVIQKLVKAAGIDAGHMPDYENLPSQGAGPEAVFPISFIGRDADTHTRKPH